MNGTAPEAKDLCPLDGRRTSNEVWIKLLVVYFTTTVAFCHLQSLRRERIVGLRLLVHLVFPLGRLFDLVLSLVVVLAWAAWWALRRKKNLKILVRRGLVLAFGTCVDEAAYQAVSEGEEEGGPPGGERPGAGLRRRRSRLDRLLGSKKLGRIIVLLALAAQCTGSIYLYVRRTEQDAALFTDELVFYLSCSGLTTTFLTLAFLLRVPFCVQPAPRDVQTNLDAVLLWTLRPEQSAYNDGLPLSLVITGSRTLLYALPIKHRLLAALMRDSWHQGDAADLKDFVSMMGFWLSCALVVMILGVGIGGALSRPGPRLWMFLTSAFEVGSFVLGVIFACLAMSAVTVPLVMLMLGFVWLLVWWVLSLCEVVLRLRVLSAWPVDQPCAPELWSDPLSNWVWGLA